MQVGDKCLKCDKPVAALSEAFGLDTGECFHRDCFKCERCRIPITDGKFTMEGKLLYHPRCRSLAAGDICHVCSKTIEDNVLTFKGTKYHSDCFTCSVCTKPLSGKPFSHVEDTLMCQTCHTAHNLKKANISTQEIDTHHHHLPADSAPAPKTVASTTASAPAVETEVPAAAADLAGGDGSPIPCEKCSKPMSLASVSLFDFSSFFFFFLLLTHLSLSLSQERVMLNDTKGFHQECFICSKCGKGFPDNKFSFHEGNLIHREVSIPFIPHPPPHPF